MAIEFISLFETSENIFANLESKYAHYNPYVGKDVFNIKLKNKIIVSISKREPSEYCDAFKNGFYSVCLDGGDWGCSYPEEDFKKACLKFDELFIKGQKEKNGS